MLFFALANCSQAQDHIPVFSSLTGTELLNELSNNYTPATVLTYGQARDTMYAKVYGENDSLSCVYTGHTLYLDPNLDPTQAVYLDGADNGINTEHTFPQGFGAGNGNPRSDMHHLYPTRTIVNNTRGNDPFAEIPDSQTSTWFYLTGAQSGTPSSNIDAYSEYTQGFFEPRESHKGNVARAMFYFYTMYKTQADNADLYYFENQRETLCQWHYLDPVDANEWNRNAKIATYQDGKKNPFILDCTLPERCYCADMDLICVPQVANENLDDVVVKFNNSPNPFQDRTNLSYELKNGFDVELVIFNSVGAKLLQRDFGHQDEGKYDFDWEASCGAGVYFCQLILADGNQQYRITRKMIVLP